MRPQRARWFDNSNPTSQWITIGQTTITGSKVPTPLLPGLCGLSSITPWKALLDDQPPT
jgi:hypothetical protein